MPEEVTTISVMELNALKAKAAKYDELREKIGKCYDEGNEPEDGLITIGEIAASHFGYLSMG